jgi:hypothetical protein
MIGMASAILCGQVCTSEGNYQFANKLGDIDTIGSCAATSYLKSQARTIPLLAFHDRDWALGSVIPGPDPLEGGRVAARRRGRRCESRPARRRSLVPVPGNHMRFRMIRCVISGPLSGK